MDPWLAATIIYKNYKDKYSFEKNRWINKFNPTMSSQEVIEEFNADIQKLGSKFEDKQLPMSELRELFYTE